MWHVPLAQVLPRPQLIFLSKTWFFGIYLKFWQQKSLKNQYLPHFESKSYQINSIKSCLSRSFQEHQRNIYIQEILHHKSKCHGTKPMHPSSSVAFQRHQEHDPTHLSSMDIITTKQDKTNYLSS